MLIFERDTCMGSLGQHTLIDQCASLFGRQLASDMEISVFKLRRIICFKGRQILEAFRNVTDRDRANFGLEPLCFQYHKADDEPNLLLDSPQQPFQRDKAPRRSKQEQSNFRFLLSRELQVWM